MRLGPKLRGSAIFLKTFGALIAAVENWQMRSCLQYNHLDPWRFFNIESHMQGLKECSCHHMDSSSALLEWPKGLVKWHRYLPYNLSTLIPTDHIVVSVTSIAPQSHLNPNKRASLVAQWWGIRLTVQETRVQSLTPEDPTCRGATRPVHHKYWACALEPGSHNYWSPCSLEPVLRNKRSPCSPKLEKSPSSNEDPAQPKINTYI